MHFTNYKTEIYEFSNYGRLDEATQCTYEGAVKGSAV